MPNWCNNTVTISHNDPAMIDRVRKGFNEGRLLNEFFPCPAEPHEHDSPVRDEALTKRFLEQYGAKDWYDWQVKNWGTKWDIGADGQPAIDNDENTLSLNFDSAWAPPTAAYEQLMDLGFKILAYYYEPGMCFCGKWEDGEDDYYEYGDMTSEEVAAAIPDDLDECFGISESMEEWEEENKENEHE